jgi:proline racemase
MQEPVTHLCLEAPAGLVHIEAECRNGKAERIKFKNVPSFAEHIKVPLEVEGYGTVFVDTAFGGDSFVMADARSLGFDVLPDEARDMAIVGRKLVAAANSQLGFHHPLLPEWRQYSFAFLTGPLEQVEGHLSSRNACVINPGKIDRSPTGTGCSALMAVLHEKGLLKQGEQYLGRSIIESRFLGKIEALCQVGDKAAIIPSISGRAWISGQTVLMCDPDDPWPNGYKLTDTWPADFKLRSQISAVA